MTFIHKVKNILHTTNGFICVITAFLMLVITFSNLSSLSRHYYTHYKIRVSLIDCCISQKNDMAFILMIIPIFLFIIQIASKNDLRTEKVLRRYSRKRIWINQVIKSEIIVFIFSMYYLIISLFAGSLYSSSFINWDSEKSLYFIVNKATTNISFTAALTFFFIFCLLSLSGISLLFLILQWFIKNKVLSWVIMTALLCLEIFYPQLSVTVNRASLSYENCFTAEMYVNMLITFILCCLTIIIGLYFSKYKEFIDDVQS